MKIPRRELLPIIRTEKSETRLWGVSLCIHAVNSVRLSVRFKGLAPMQYRNQTLAKTLTV
ncbi:IS3 family transposase [Corynebacterium diphtheriae]|uniref:IS3 family transposase n=1 Tax=Corynebacterium diphtheriae TaxID=1717 RepID=UPI000D403E3F|nr:hypothetical protein BT092_06765 [Corynebacterium diphtheriae]